MVLFLILMGMWLACPHKHNAGFGVGLRWNGMVVCERQRENMSVSTEYIVYSVILIFHYSKCIEFSKSRMGFLMSFQHLCS